MKNDRSFIIEPNHVEQFLLLFGAFESQPLVRHSFPFNQVASEGTIKYMRYHNHNIGNFPVFFNFNGIQYRTLTGAEVGNWVVTLADRNGDYCCIDMPLANFMQFSGNWKMIKELHLDLDYNKCYIRTMEPVPNADPLAIIFYLDMYPKLDK